MAARIRDTNWINDKDLEGTLRKLVDKLKRKEISSYTLIFQSILGAFVL